MPVPYAQLTMLRQSGKTIWIPGSVLSPDGHQRGSGGRGTGTFLIEPLEVVCFDNSDREGTQRLGSAHGPIRVFLK